MANFTIVSIRCALMPSMRPINLISLSIAFALGASSLWFFHQLPSIPFPLMLTLGCFLLAFLCVLKFRYLPSLFFFLAGFFWCYTGAEKVLHDRLPPALEGIPLVLTGTIIAIPEGGDKNLHFEFLAKNVTQTIPFMKMRLSWYSTGPTFPPLKVGETWKLTVKLKQPRSTFNPASFDYEGWLFTHHISAVGYVIDKATHQKIAASISSNPINAWRESIQEKLEAALPQNPNLGMIEALAIGVRDQLTPEQWHAMQATGTNHLVAIAGLHVGFVVAFVYALTKFFWRRIPFLMLYVPAHEAAIFFALLAAFYYSALAGFAIPTQRACVMLTIGLLANLWRRNLPPWQALAAALFAVLLYDPLSVFEMSFWLSFVAVFVILFAIHGRRQHRSKLWQSLRIQWVIAFGLAPLTLYFFHQISLINLIANSIAIPWVAFLALPLILLGVFLAPFFPMASDAAWWLAAKTLIPYWPTISWLASLDRLQWQLYIPHVGSLILAMFGTLLVLAPRGFPLRVLGWFGFLPLLFPRHEALPLNTFNLSLLDVGQGLSCLVQTAHHTLVYDTGPALSASYDMGESVVVPALQYAQTQQVDAMIISHGDNDHSGGAKAVLQHIPIKFLLTSVPMLYADLPETLPEHIYQDRFTARFQKHWAKPQILRCETGQHWQWDGVDFEILSPDYDYYPRKGNDRSCVLRISTPFHHLLLPGDIEKMTEQRLMGRTLSSDILVAPHHGSKTSSSPEFVNAVHPTWVLYATGYRNKFHFPNEGVMARYQQIQAQFADTAKDGEIMISVPNPPGALNVIRSREKYKHFWNF